jgi:hypothetical protein
MYTYSPFPLPLSNRLLLCRPPEEANGYGLEQKGHSYCWGSVNWYMIWGGDNLAVSIKFYLFVFFLLFFFSFYSPITSTLINPTVNFQSSSNLTCLQHLRFYNNRLAIDHSLPPKFLSPLASCAPPFLGYVPALLDAPFNLVNWFLLISQPLNIGMSLRPLLLTPLLIYFSLTEELIYPTLI